jgi:hypothetical protein
MGLGRFSFPHRISSPHIDRFQGHLYTPTPKLPVGALLGQPAG